MAEYGSGGKASSRRIATVIIIVAAVALIAAFCIVLGPRLVHHCDNCDKLFFGTGYKANLISDALTTITGKESKVICRECAKKEHALSIASGASLEDFRIPLFPEK